jgi:hypothetical protein
VDEKIKKMPNGKAIKNRVMGRMGGGWGTTYENKKR